MKSATILFGLFILMLFNASSKPVTNDSNEIKVLVKEIGRYVDNSGKEYVKLKTTIKNVSGHKISYVSFQPFQRLMFDIDNKDLELQLWVGCPRINFEFCTLRPEEEKDFLFEVAFQKAKHTAGKIKSKLWMGDT